MVVAPSEIDKNTYFIFRSLRDGTSQEVKFTVKNNMVVRALSDPLYVYEMEWIRKNIFTGVFDKAQAELKLLEQ